MSSTLSLIEQAKQKAAYAAVDEFVKVRPSLQLVFTHYVTAARGFMMISLLRHIFPLPT